MLLAAVVLAAAPDFAVRLWQALPTDQGNVVVSPTSVEACLGLLIPAVGPTSTGPLAKALGTPVAEFGAYEKDLQSRLRTLAADGETTIANAGFFREAPRPEYVGALAQGYGATAQRLLPGTEGLRQVNGWVDARTKGRIPKLFARLAPQTHAIFVNAVTFDGDWAKAFAPGSTEKADFHAPGGARKVDLMRNAKLDVPYARGAGFRTVRLPYQGGRYRMTVLLPDAGDPAGLLKDAAWRDLPTTGQNVDLSLPKFTVRSEPDVEGALKRMGLAPLFARIDLSRALPGGGADAIGQIVHRTYVKVDEKGTQAAASTGIATSRVIRAPQEAVVFRVDRPFAFAIQREATGEILFEGVIREP